MQAGQFNDIEAAIEKTKALPGPVGEAMMNGVEYLFNKGKLEGRLEGKLEGKLETARNLLKIGLPVEQIVQATGLTEAEVTELQTKH